MSTAISPIRADDDLGGLAQAARIPLAAYRHAHVRSCVARMLVRTGLTDVAALTERIRFDDAARAAFRRCVLVGVTTMFRDREQFDIVERLVPGLLAGRRRLNVWSAGCSNGDELVSVAELLRKRGALPGAFLLGTDVRGEALASAQARRVEGAVLRFERNDLVLDDPPSRRFDLILCRNVGIYLERETQRAVHAKLVSALRPGGYLMLGRSETLVQPERLGLERISRHMFRRAP